MVFSSLTDSTMNGLIIVPRLATVIARVAAAMGESVVFQNPADVRANPSGSSGSSILVA